MTNFFNLPSKAGQDAQNQYLAAIAQHLGVTAGNLQDAINMANQANQAATAKITDLETRFQTLTAEQQQDAEVIDARDGETSLRARLDRDHAYHKNILHNWDFRNPVNQRGFTSTTSAGYTIDRWRLTASGHTVELVYNGIKLIASKNASLNNCFVQLVENYSRFAGVPLTLRVHVVENTLTQGCNLRWNEYVGPAIMGTGYFSYTFTPASLSLLQIGVQFADRNVDDGKYVIIDKMKLEIGTVSTLAKDPPADYGEQLALCQRYALNTGNEIQIRASGYTANTIIFSLPIPVTMRVNPSLESGTVEVITPAGSSQSGFTFGYFARSGVLSIVATKTSHGLTDATLKVANAVFSSDL